MKTDLLYQMALANTSGIGWVQAKLLIENFGSAQAIFTAKLSSLKAVDGIGEIRARYIKDFVNFQALEDEIKFIEKYKITPLFITDSDYPQRLLNCYDSPTLLFYKGNANLNATKIIAVVGTRNMTEYGKLQTEKLIDDLAAQDILVISGLALGIDAVVHKAALKNKLNTVGVLAHGLSKLYPAQHKAMTTEMIKQGGLLTEFLSNTKPDRHNFPIRNRIVAGMSDAVVVMETAIKGGSMITAELANGYNKDVFALPGKVTDSKSAGCNYLIRQNKAMLLTDAEELLQIMGWEENRKKKKVLLQKELFIELSKEERIIMDILTEKEAVPIDEINIKSNLSSSAVAAAILHLELKGIIQSLPGKCYKLL